MSEIIEYIKGQDATINKIMNDLTDFNNQNLESQAAKGRQLIANQVVYSEAIKMMGDEIFELGIENETLREKIGEVDEKWLQESKERNKLIYDDTSKNQFILERMKRQYNKKLKQIQ